MNDHRIKHDQGLTDFSVFRIVYVTLLVIAAVAMSAVPGTQAVPLVRRVIVPTQGVRVATLRSAAASLNEEWIGLGVTYLESIRGRLRNGLGKIALWSCQLKVSLTHSLRTKVYHLGASAHLANTPLIPPR